VAGIDVSCVSSRRLDEDSRAQVPTGHAKQRIRKRGRFRARDHPLPPPRELEEVGDAAGVYRADADSPVYLDIELIEEDTVLTIVSEGGTVANVTATTEECAETVHEEEEFIELGESVATAVTVAASVAVAVSVGASVGGAVGGGGASSAGSGALDGSGDLLSVIAQVQFCVLSATLSLLLREGVYAMGAGLSWLNFQIKIPGMPKIGKSATTSAPRRRVSRRTWRPRARRRRSSSSKTWAAALR